ncbi:NERD domain-containing protein [Plantactinospora sp. ZYX-F-223]|uniref:NERD domain-containing protein n=1 Tax=Plantactinospora sp. ZYX-F-223 TaxID=3144103 RepID=UPI0031FE01D2
MQDGRWTTITPSQFDHERAALEHIRRHLPDAEPYRAWSNFTFTADTGHVYEIDLLVAARAGLYLIEIKSLHAAPLARYGAMELLEELADLARGGAGAVWLLCPMEDPGQLPRLDATVVPVA